MRPLSNVYKSVMASLTVVPDDSLCPKCERVKDETVLANVEPAKAAMMRCICGETEVQGRRARETPLDDRAPHEIPPDELIDYPAVSPWSPKRWEQEQERYFTEKQGDWKAATRRLEEQTGRLQERMEMLMEAHRRLTEQRNAAEAPTSSREEKARGEDASEGDPWSQFRPGGDTPRAGP